MDEKLADLAWPVGIAFALYVAASYALGFFVRGRVHDEEDFLVAGRRLSLPLAWATLLATWFGAGTMLTAADEVRNEGLRVTALEPLGPGICLLLAGAFFARRLWEMRLLTLSDFFARRFGPRAELLSAFIMVPGYFGWIAVQFIALAGMLELFLGLDPTLGIALIAVIGMGYTLLGGMWAVTMTDALQLSLLLAGLLILGTTVLLELGDGAGMIAGLARIGEELPPEMLDPLPTETATAFFGWASVLAIAALGNIPGQDLLQRIFSSRSSSVARNACLFAGVAYIAFGAIPVILGLSAGILLPESRDQAIVPALAGAFLSPPLAIVFTVALASAVLSTIDSAILAPASVIAQNILPRFVRGPTPLARSRAAVVGVTAASLGVAYIGEDAYTLLEAAYELGLVGLFVPLAIGLYRRPGSEMPALLSMGVGVTLWLVHLGLGWEAFLQPMLAPAEIPISLSLVTINVVLYLLADRTTA